jgi:hypothetical protein
MKSESREALSDLEETFAWLIPWVVPGVFIAALAWSHLRNGELIGVGYLVVGLVWVPLTLLVLQDLAWEDAAQAGEVEGRNDNIGPRTAAPVPGDERASAGRDGP